MASAWAKVDTTATCRTVVVDLGRPGQPELALTQTQSFAVDGAGRAVVPAADACDPNRVAPSVESDVVVPRTRGPS